MFVVLQINALYFYFKLISLCIVTSCKDCANIRNKDFRFFALICECENQVYCAQQLEETLTGPIVMSLNRVMCFLSSDSRLCICQ